MMNKNITTYAYGFPRLGKHREFKKNIESFWKGDVTEDRLHQQLQQLYDSMIATYEQYGVAYPLGEMTLYDKMLDTALLLGVYQADTLADYFALCRGRHCLEMTKWFNTNYHYLVPDLKHGFPYLPQLWQTRNRYVTTKPITDQHPAYAIGPYTFVKLAKGIAPGQFADRLMEVVHRYAIVLAGLPAVHFDEPAFVLDTTAEEQTAITAAYNSLAAAGIQCSVFTYYDAVDWLPKLLELPIQGLGLDCVQGDTVRRLQQCSFPEDKTLYVGVVQGRNVFRTQLNTVAALIQSIQEYIPTLVLTNAAPLFHLPLSIYNATTSQPQLQQLAFAEERLFELGALQLIAQGTPSTDNAIQQWNQPSNYSNAAVQNRLRQLQDNDFMKPVSYAKRSALQQDRLHLPLFPTTTIGSYPQTPDVRQQRAAYKSGKISAQQYQTFIADKIRDLIRFQETIGLDVLVHGEYERSDMVEFFAEQLDGMLAPSNGWIISYGTRCYRAPIIYGDVSRPHPLTVHEIAYAQTLTHKPVKGMLTGPVTIIAWSFCREDIPTEHIAYQISLCLQDEIRDYETAGIKLVQVDEPAFREKAPLKRAGWPEYFAWATKAFRLATNTNPATQIHTHMCYSEFNEIIEYIQQMDFDVISIECSRSKGEVIAAFKNHQFDRQIGLGVWDIHSPTVPTVTTMVSIIQASLRNIPAQQFWINPDCGLKTRDWPETKAALSHLISARQQLLSDTAVT